MYKNTRELIQAQNGKLKKKRKSDTRVLGKRPKLRNSGDVKVTRGGSRIPVVMLGQSWMMLDLSMISFLSLGRFCT